MLCFSFSARAIGCMKFIHILARVLFFFFFFYPQQAVKLLLTRSAVHLCMSAYSCSSRTSLNSPFFVWGYHVPTPSSSLLQLISSSHVQLKPEHFLLTGRKVHCVSYRLMWKPLWWSSRWHSTLAHIVRVCTSNKCRWKFPKKGLHRSVITMMRCTVYLVLFNLTK